MYEVGKAIGIIEIQNYSNALIACDLVSKHAYLDLIHNKRNLGGRLVTLVFAGSVSDLQEAFESLRRTFAETKYLKVCEVVPKPAEALMTFFEKGDFRHD